MQNNNAAQIAAPTLAQRPIWIRLPRPKTLCPWTSLNRWKLLEIVKLGKVKNKHLIPKGSKRGVRLVHLESLLAYLEQSTEEAA